MIRGQALLIDPTKLLPGAGPGRFKKASPEPVADADDQPLSAQPVVTSE